MRFQEEQEIILPIEVAVGEGQLMRLKRASQKAPWPGTGGGVLVAGGPSFDWVKQPALGEVQFLSTKTKPKKLDFAARPVTL